MLKKDAKSGSMGIQKSGIIGREDQSRYVDKKVYSRHLGSWFVLVFVGLVYTSQSLSATQLNAMCFAENAGEIKPFQATSTEASQLKKEGVVLTDTTEEAMAEKFRIASLSKLLTSHWALMTLGPHYRFETKFYLSRTDKNGQCKLHIQGSMDPYFGKEILQYTLVQIQEKAQSQACSRVSEVSVDQYVNYRSDLYAYRDYHKAAWNAPTPYLGQAAILQQLQSSMTYTSVKYLSREDFDQMISSSEGRVQYRLFTVKSRPLAMMLKDFNSYSYNYPPEVLFLRLGGRSAYSQFIKKRLNLGSDQVEMHNGSGYPFVESGIKRYNLVSCLALVQIVRDMDYVLKNAFSVPLSLSDVMGVTNKDEVWTTFKNHFSDPYFEDRIVAKTGTADQAITFSGKIAIAGGGIYFATLTSPISSANQARDDIRSLVGALMQRYPIGYLKYKPSGEMLAFDTEAQLQESSLVSSNVAQLRP